MGLILICDVSEFSPKEISISWKKDNLPLNTTLYDNGPTTVSAGNTFSTYSILKIGRDEAGGRGGIYVCVVHHSSSSEPFMATEKVSIGKQQMIKQIYWHDTQYFLNLGRLTKLELIKSLMLKREEQLLPPFLFGRNFPVDTKQTRSVPWREKNHLFYITVLC